MREYPPALPHGSIEQIGAEAFCVRGRINLNRLLRLSRNMAIVRQGRSLTLINAVRMNDSGLAALDSLGRVEHVLRLGGGHGLDDPFYVDWYQAQFWAQPGGKRYTEPKITQPLIDQGDLPFAGASLLTFRTAKIPEAAIALEAGPGLLLTCDSIQHYGDYSNNNLPARLMMPWIGFPKRTIIGPFWLRAAAPEGKSLRGDFERLLDYRFDGLLGAHGTFLARDATANVTGAIAQAFGNVRAS
jgi:hypothetical protein